MDVQALFAEFLKKAVAALNEDAQAAEASGNPYARFLLPSAVTNYQPGQPPYDEQQVKHIVEEAMANMSNGEFMEVMKRVVDIGLSLLPGT